MNDLLQLHPNGASVLTDRVDYPLFVVTATAPAAHAAGRTNGRRRRGANDTLERSGCVVGFVTQCSIEPARLLICISTVNHTYGVALRAESLALHLLGFGQHETARLFAEGTGDRVDKFDHCDWYDGMTGAPILSHCSAWVEGPILSHTPVGDHEAFVINPTHGGPGDKYGQLTVGMAPRLRAAHPAG